MKMLISLSTASVQIQSGSTWDAVLEKLNTVLKKTGYVLALKRKGMLMETVTFTLKGKPIAPTVPISTSRLQVIKAVVEGIAKVDGSKVLGVSSSKDSSVRMITVTLL